MSATKPTHRQKKLVGEIIKNKGSLKKSMLNAGYSSTTARVPQIIMEGEGFKMLCRQRGLTEEFLVQALVQDIEEKPRNRKPEIELGAKMLGLLTDKREVKEDTTVEVKWGE